MSLIGQVAALALAAASMLSAGMDQALPQRNIDGTLFLVNREYMITKNYVPETDVVNVKGSSRLMRADAADALEAMFAAAKSEANITLLSVSGYRSFSKQTTIYNNKLKSVGTAAKANEYVALPGASEHQLGMAMDLGQSGYTSLNNGFGATKGGKWVVENAHRFGFILRYQEGWESVTGYNYEPWHVRYVGVEHATRMYEQNVPMEAYILDLRVETLLAILE